MIRFPVENMSLVALFVFQLAKLHIFGEIHNKMIIFFCGVNEVNEVIASLEVRDNSILWEK